MDHVYVNNLASVGNVNFKTPTFGDQVLIMVELYLKNALSGIAGPFFMFRIIKM